MPSFDKSLLTTPRQPFGKNQFLRSRMNIKTESYTLATNSVPVETIDTFINQKIVQSGELMAKIITGPDAGKIGPFQRGSGAAGAAAVNEVQTLTSTATGGTFTISLEGSTTTPIAFNATGATVQAALEATVALNPGDITVTGGASGPWVVTFVGPRAATAPALFTIDNTLATGGTVTVAMTTPGTAAGTWLGAAADGRGNTANIVGICDTFVPWQLNERDVDVAVVVACHAVQAWCFERDAVTGLRIPLTNNTRDAVVANVSTRLIRFS